MIRGLRGRSERIWTAIAIAALVLAPWYMLPGGGVLDPAWLGRFPDAATAPALWHVARDKPWLATLALPLLPALGAAVLPRHDPRGAPLLILAGGLGLALLLLQGFALDHRGWQWAFLAGLAGPTDAKQGGFGAGATLYALAALFLASIGLARRGYCRGDAFTVGAVALVTATTALFVFFPVAI
ncbi:MAG: iron ABC transporter permease, partial [Alphaproteobacteria bacterium]|nr:iron ABC transporter permease [Alphaproteobacteria bacterium]